MWAPANALKAEYSIELQGLRFSTSSLVTRGMISPSLRNTYIFERLCELHVQKCFVLIIVEGALIVHFET